MPLILAIEPDRRQASNLASVLRRRPRTELVIAESAAVALDTLAARVPDVLLTSPLLSPQDETALAAWMRNLGPAAARVQALTIPILATGPVDAPRSRGVMSVLRRKAKRQSKPDGCAPDVFADQVDVYLERTSSEREIEPEPEPEPILAVAPEPEPEPVVEPAPEPEPVPVFAAQSEPEPVLLAEPLPEPIIELAVEAAVEPIVEPVVEPPPRAKQPSRLRGLLATFVRWREAAAHRPVPAEPPQILPALALAPEPATATVEARVEPAVPPIEPDDEPWIELSLEELREFSYLPTAAGSHFEPKEEETPVWVIPPLTDLDEIFVTPLPEPAPIVTVVAAPPPAPAPAAAPAPEPVPKPEPKAALAPPRPPKKKDAKARKPKPVQDEWGFFDPDQCGFTALLAKLDEITEDEMAAEKRDDTTVRLVAY